MKTSIEDFIENIFYGKDEDRWERYARRKEKKEFERKYGGKHTLVWVPGLFAYSRIKEDLKIPEFTKKEKAIFCAVDIGCELVLDAIKIGCIYGAYRFYDYLF